jgi:hypothetical protein
MEAMWLIGDYPKDYATCVKELRKFMLKTSVVKEFNPVLLNIKLFDDSQLAKVILEHSQFLSKSIHFLLEASIRCYDWPGLREEIENNIKEEKGLKTKNVPHLEIMRRGFRKDLGIEPDRRETSNVTIGFTKRMETIFSHDDNAYVAGALLALEGTAISEFYTLDEIVKHYLKLQGKELQEGDTKYYIDGHKLFEVGHEESLRIAIEPYIDGVNITRFVKGYVAVCLAIHVWWNQIFYEKASYSITFVEPFRRST